MGDFIEREDAIEFVSSLVDTMSVCISIDECIGMKSMKSRAISAISDVPSAEVRENVRGKWNRNGQTAYTCSNCSAICSFGNSYRFCPWCGADMRGENHDDT